MTEKPGMSDERLAELREARSAIRSRLSPGGLFATYWMLADAVDEIDRQRAELAAKDAEIAARNVALELIALNPEPAP